MTERAAAGRAPARHDLLWLTVDGWQALAARQPGLFDMAGLRLWAAHGFPVMRRRTQPADVPGLIPVAVALPDAFGRARLGFEVAPADVALYERPPELRAAWRDLPDRLRSLAERVLAVAEQMDLVPRMFGSAMWQHVIGLPYLRPQSDLDLLWSLPHSQDPLPLVARLVSSLCALNADSGPRLDGEIVLDGTRAVNWRELGADASGEVLVKTAEKVSLMSRDRFMRPEPCTC